MANKKWSAEQRAKYKATMAARKTHHVKRGPKAPTVIYAQLGDRLVRMTLRSIKAYVVD